MAAPRCACCIRTPTTPTATHSSATAATAATTRMIPPSSSPPATPAAAAAEPLVVGGSAVAGAVPVPVPPRFGGLWPGPEEGAGVRESTRVGSLGLFVIAAGLVFHPAGVISRGRELLVDVDVDVGAGVGVGVGTGLG